VDAELHRSGHVLFPALFQGNTLFSSRSAPCEARILFGVLLGCRLQRRHPPARPPTRPQAPHLAAGSVRGRSTRGGSTATATSIARSPPPPRRCPPPIRRPSPLLPRRGRAAADSIAPTDLPARRRAAHVPPPHAAGGARPTPRRRPVWRGPTPGQRWTCGEAATASAPPSPLSAFLLSNSSGRPVAPSFPSSPAACCRRLSAAHTAVVRRARCRSSTPAAWTGG